ncbi:MAG: TonB-dependent receptor plug domain-containing protein, partial [Woeseiaceae bacterium]
LQARYVSDLLKTVPGFSVSQSGGVGSLTQVRVRGAESNHVLVLIDGVRANDPATGDEFRWEYLTTGDVERVEIVRGPQSALWGSDAVAAVVHVVTNRNQSAPRMNAYAEGGSNSTGNAGLSGSTGADNWSLNGGLEYLDTGGTNVSRTGSEDDGSDVTTISLGGRLDASDALTFAAGIRAVDAYSQYDPVDFIVTGLPTDGDVATESDTVYANFGGTYHRADSRLTHRLTARYFESDNRNLVDGAEDSSSASDRSTFMYQADIGLGEHRLSLALEHEATSFEQRGAIGFGDPNQDQDMDVTSFVADFEANTSERLTWLFSARFDDNSDFEDAVTGRASVAYLLSDNTTLRGNIGTGQKNPTFTERYGFFPGQFIGNASLDPEKSTSYEIGVDHTFAQGNWSVSATAFHQDLEDEINGFVFDPVTFLFTADNIDGDSERSGAEFGATWHPSERFDLAASYTYTDSSEQDVNGIEVAELRRPRHSGSLSMNYRSAGERFKTSFQASYGGTRSDVFFPPFPQPSEVVTLSNYWLVDMTVHFQLTDSVSLFARGANLFDEDYEQVYGYRTPGRTGYVGVRTNFGRGGN